MTRPLLVVVPTRSRPQNIDRLVTAWCDTATGAADLALMVDEDDPTLKEYERITQGTDEWLSLHIGPRLGLAGSLNDGATMQPQPQYIGFMGDDHLPRTAGWDHAICRALEEVGFCYGDDLLQRQNLPTAVFMRSSVVAALGYFCPPTLRHMYLDNVWLDWGRGVDSIRFLSDVVIEHMHPGAGKGAFDASYQETNGFMAPDLAAYNEYKATAYEADLAKIRAVL